ncbi:MAG: hypothetical protein ACAH17_00410 [Candidatus Paceibacterota bacterium]
MSTHAFLKQGSEASPSSLIGGEGKRPALYLVNTRIHELKDLDEAFFSKNVEEISVRDFFDKSTGFRFIPGRYKGLGYEVEITTPSTFNKTGGKHPLFDERQELRGRFETLPIAKAFWEELKSGDLLPTEPLCVTLDPTTATYAKKASLAVANSAKIRELEASLAQAWNHIQNLSQIIQDKTLTPAIEQ